MKRHALGVFAVLLLVIGLLLYFRGPRDNSMQTLAGACVRVGAVLGAGWVAFRQVQNLFRGVPLWMLALTAVGILMIAARPRTVFFVVPALVLLWFLRPRSPKSGSKPRSPSRSSRPLKTRDGASGKASAPASAERPSAHSSQDR